MIGTKHSIREMIAALKRVGSLPGAEADREALVDIARILAEITVSAAAVRQKASKLHTERIAFQEADRMVKPDAG